MGDRKPLSARAEDYLKAVLFLSEEEGGATSKRICAELGISPGTATAMFKRLAAAGLLDYAPYGVAKLTGGGEKKAREMVRHHRLIETFLHRTLHYPLGRVHGEADALEHVISEELEERIAGLLGHPALDPHGSPIPDRDGRAGAEPDLQALSEIVPETVVAISALRHRDPQALAYLEEKGLVPGAELSVLERKPFHGPVIVRVRGKTPLALGHELAAKIMVGSPGKAVKS